VLCTISDFSHCQFTTSNLSNYNSKALYKTTNISKNKCFEKIIYIIKTFKAEVIKINLQQDYIIAYKFNKQFSYCLDTTEVNFHIIEEKQSLNTNKSTIIITSNNSLLAYLVYNSLCKILYL
jgi:hypothetical protein